MHEKQERGQTMILTDYYRFEKLPNCKSKLRIDCTASTNSYEPMEVMRATRAVRHRCNVGDLFCYYGDVPDTFGGNVHRKADKALTKTKNISSIFIIDAKSNLGYGDMKGTADALLFVFTDAKVTDGRLQAGAVIDIFVARGYAKNREALYNELSDGILDEEMNQLRVAATKSVAAAPKGE